MNWTSPTVAKLRFTVNRPNKVEKLPLLALTEEEEQQLIKDFISVIERPPTEEEICELISEEVKIKQGREVAP